MAKPRAIRKRILSVRNIYKITRTMERVAQSKVMKLSGRHVLARSFRHEMARLIPMSMGLPLENPQAAYLLSSEPLCAPRPPGRVFLFCVTSSRGLCGGYNSHVIQAVKARMRALEAEGREFQLGVMGKKGLAYFRFYNEPVVLSVLEADEAVGFTRVSEIADELMARFLRAEVSSVEVISTRFRSKAVQEVRTSLLLPYAPAKEAAGPGEEVPPYLVEPARQEALSRVLPMTVKTELFCVVLEAFLSEHSQRAIAMRSASDNANSMIKRLTLMYNRARQAQITNEMIEIVSGSVEERGRK